MREISARHLLLDVSEGGIYFVTQRRLEVEDPITVFLAFSSLSIPGLAARGSVARVGYSIGVGGFETGVRFTGISRRNAHLLRQVIATAVLGTLRIPSTGTYRMQDCDH